MRATAAALLAVALAAIGSIGVVAQSPPQPQRTAPPAAAPASGVIQGVVVAADTDTPLRLAHVVLIGAATGTLKVTSTEADGRFSFSGIPADRYTVGASKLPYIGALAGAKRPARSGTPVVVAAGATVTNVVVRLPPGAAISGVITNDLGQPALGTFVGLRTWQMRGAERVMVNAQAPMTGTDERGRYRIAGLPPGDYIVSAMPSGAALPVKMQTTSEVDAALKGNAAPTLPFAPTMTLDRYAPSYYPGTARPESAVVITIAPGEDRQNVDFRVEKAQTARVEGTVIASGGGPVGNDPRAGARVTMRTASTDATFQTTYSAAIGPEGRFTFASVAPGSYVASMAMQNGDFASAAIEVNGIDVAGVQMVMRPPIAVRGRIVFAGAAPLPALGGRQISLKASTPDGQNMAPAVGLTQADGSFEIARLVPGRYKVGAVSFGASVDQLKWALQSVVVDGRDLTDRPIEVGADAPPKDIVVTYTDRWQEISGRLQLSSGAPATDYSVVVFPADRNDWVYESRRIAIARPSSTGQFTFGGPGPASLPPGNYLIAAVTDIERGEQFSVPFLTALAAQSIPLTLAAGERKTQDLAIK